MIDDDHFMSAGIRLDESAGQMSYEAGGFVAGADDDGDGVLLGGLFFWGSIPGQPSEEPTVVEQLYQGDQTKNNTKDFEPGETPIQFSHKRAGPGAYLIPARAVRKYKFSAEDGQKAEP